MGRWNVLAMSAVTLHVSDMARSLDFYDTLGFARHYGDATAEFASLHVGSDSYLNLQLNGSPPAGSWGRVIVHVSDVDAVHATAKAAGLRPESDPTDAPWGERYFHIRDPDGHEISIARRMAAGTLSDQWNGACSPG